RDWSSDVCSSDLGRFFDSIISGEALNGLARKIGMNIDILTQSWMTLVLPLIIIGVFWMALNPTRFGLRGLHDAFQRIPLLRAARISLAILLGVGTVINDSGIDVPAVGILFLVPILTHIETFRPGQSQPTGDVPAGGGPGAAGEGPAGGGPGVAGGAVAGGGPGAGDVDTASESPGAAGAVTADEASEDD